MYSTWKYMCIAYVKVGRKERQPKQTTCTYTCTCSSGITAIHVDVVHVHVHVVHEARPFVSQEDVMSKTQQVKQYKKQIDQLSNETATYKQQVSEQLHVHVHVHV